MYRINIEPTLSLPRQRSIREKYTDYIQALSGVMAFTADGKNFGQFTVNMLPLFPPDMFFTVNFFLRLTVKFCQFLRLTAKFFGRFTADG